MERLVYVLDCSDGSFRAFLLLASLRLFCANSVWSPRWKNSHLQNNVKPLFWEGTFKKQHPVSKPNMYEEES